MNKDTIVINIVSGPGAGKTTLASALFFLLKAHGKYVVEFVSEYAKNLVWASDYESLNNQRQVSHEQYKTLLSKKGKVDFIITDGSLLHGLYYNRTNKDNNSNVDKTHAFILEKFNEFHNLVFFLNRNTTSTYEQQGRQQTELEAKEVDVELKGILVAEHIPFIDVKSPETITEMSLMDLARAIKRCLF